METEARHSEKVAERDPLAVRLADGDPLAARDLIERHYTELYRYVFAMLRDEAAVEDVVQDTFERALGALGRYSEERLRAMLLRPWLYRITLNVVRNRLRRNWEVPVGRELSVVSSVPAVGFGERWEDVMDVLETLGCLPERQRTAVALRYLQDLPYAEICAITGWPEGTAKTLVRRGLARLRDLLIVEDTKDGGNCE